MPDKTVYSLCHSRRHRSQILNPKGKRTIETNKKLAPAPIGPNLLPRTQTNRPVISPPTILINKNGSFLWARK